MKTKAEVEDLLTKISEFEMALADLKSQVASLQTQGTEVKTGVIYDAPEIGDGVYSLISPGEVCKVKYSKPHAQNLAQGNLFYDQASAELEVKRRAIRHRLAKFCRDAWDEAGIELDWIKPAQRKHMLGWDSDDSRLTYDTWMMTQFSDHVVPTHECLEEVKKAFTNAELKLALTGSE